MGIIKILRIERLDLDHKKEVILNNHVHKHVHNIFIFRYNIMESVIVKTSLNPSLNMEKTNVPVD